MVDEFSVPFITWQVVDRLMLLLRECRRRGVPEPFVYPNSGGGVQLEWRFGDGNGPEVELLNADRVTYFDPTADSTELCSVTFDAVSIIDWVVELYADRR